MSALTDWISAIGQAGAAVGTVAAVILALNLARRDSRRREQEDERHQAELITAWLVADDFNDAEMRGKIKCTIYNSSHQVAYDLMISLVSTHGALRKTAAGIDNSQRGYETFVGQFPPGQLTYFLPYPGSALQVRYSAEIAFRDAAGRFWLRDGHGHLKRVPKEPIVLFGSGPPPPGPATPVYG